jgi:hypothetical protein
LVAPTIKPLKTGNNVNKKLTAPSAKDFNFECKVEGSKAMEPKPKLLKRKAEPAKVDVSKVAAKAKNTVKPKNEKAAPTDEPAKKKKRAAWDVKGRLEDLEAFNSNTEARFKEAINQIDDLNTKLSESQTTGI